MEIKRVLTRKSNFVRWNAYEAERKAALKEIIQLAFQVVFVFPQVIVAIMLAL